MRGVREINGTESARLTGYWWNSASNGTLLDVYAISYYGGRGLMNFRAMAPIDFVFHRRL